MSCDSCQMLSINGVPCHETGCPDEWRDYSVDCFECGFAFTPEERHQRVCPDCIYDADHPICFHCGETEGCSCHETTEDEDDDV